MDPALAPAVLKEIIPMVAIAITFGFPVLIVFVIQHFKFKNRELQAELESRRLLGERDRAYLESRIERLEQVVMSQAGRGYGAPPLAMSQQAPVPPNPVGPLQGPMLANPGLFEPPPVPEGPQTAPGGKREPTR